MICKTVSYSSTHCVMWTVYGTTILLADQPAVFAGYWFTKPSLQEVLAVRLKMRKMSLVRLS